MTFFPPTEDFKRAVEEAMDEILPDKIFNSVWNDFFRYYTQFDSMLDNDGTSLTFENTGDIKLTLDGWTITVDTNTATSFMEKVQIPTLGGSSVGLNKNVSWGQRQRFRANFSFSDLTKLLNYDNQTANFTVGQTLTGGNSGDTGVIVADEDSGTTGTLHMSGVTDAETFQDGETITDGMAGSADANGTSFASPQFTAYIVRGATPQSNFNHPNFGFKISNSTNGNSVALLQGVCRDSSGGGEATVDLQNVSNNTAYMVEARYLPSNKVIFLVQNNTTLKMEEKGVITTNLPDPTNTNTEAFYGMEITRVNGHAVQLLGSFFEYQQQLRQF